MRTWIFQADPKKFDVDRFLDEGIDSITWPVTRYSEEIGIGDRVFLWRSVENEAKKDGIVAEMRIVASAENQNSYEIERGLWLDSTEADQLGNRVCVELVRRASKKEILKKDWLLEDPILRNLLVIRSPSGINFSVTNDESVRLEKMWMVVGQTWSRNESLAGLWAYAKTLNGAVSKKDESPVGEVSRITGRSVAGVYNKVMNFRSIDPRDGRAGMSGAGHVDKEIWSEFYNSENLQLDVGAIVEEFKRVWGTQGIPNSSNADVKLLDATLLREAEVLAEKSLSELLAVYKKRYAAGRPIRPPLRVINTTVYDRSALVIAIAKVRSGDRCDVPGCLYIPFIAANGRPYLEVHHIKPLSEGGTDFIENVACLCPAHHREAHFGQECSKIIEQLRELRNREAE